MTGFGPLAGAPVGAIGASVPPPVLVDLADAIAGTASLTAADVRAACADALASADLLAGFDLPNLIDAIAMTGSPSAWLHARSQLSESARFDETVGVAWSMLLEEGMQLGAVAAAHPLLLAVMADAMAATGVATSRLDALAALSGALAMESLMANGWSVAAVDSVTFNDALDAAARFFGPLVDQAGIADGAEFGLRVVAIAQDGAALEDAAGSVAHLLATAEDGALLYATVRLAGNEYAGWVLNTTTRAPSEYRGFNFDSLVTWQGRTFGAGAGGIFELGGDSDDGDPIQAFIRTGLSDFGSGKLKRVPDLYLGYAGNGDVVLKVIITSETGEKSEEWYRQAMKPAESVREGRLQIARGLKSRYWQFELCNTAGAAIEFADVRLRPIILDRRV